MAYSSLSGFDLTLSVLVFICLQYLVYATKPLASRDWMEGTAPAAAFASMKWMQIELDAN